jgi:HSP20 family protein
MYEEDDALVVEASVPGFQREDIAIQLHQGLLSIVASRPEQTTDAPRHYYRRERPVGSWTRRIALPGIVHDATVDAELKQGVLTLRIPVPAYAKPRQIEIRTDDGRLSAATSTASWNGDEEHVAAEPATAARN